MTDNIVPSLVPPDTQSLDETQPIAAVPPTPQDSPSQPAATPSGDVPASPEQDSEPENLTEKIGIKPGPRKVRMVVSRVDPLSALKVGFLVSTALAIMGSVAAVVLWVVLDFMHVFSSMESFIGTVGAGTLANMLDLLHFSRVLALAVIFGVIQMVLLSALAWLSAVIYNVICGLVGGLHVTLTED